MFVIFCKQYPRVTANERVQFIRIVALVKHRGNTNVQRNFIYKLTNMRFEKALLLVAFASFNRGATRRTSRRSNFSAM